MPMNVQTRIRVTKLGGMTMTPKRLAVLRQTVKKAQAALRAKRAAKKVAEALG